MEGSDRKWDLETLTITKVPWKKLMPCPFTGPKMFCAGPNILCQPKN